MNRVVLLLALAMAAPQAAAQQQEQPAAPKIELTAVKSLRCEIWTGSLVKWDAGKPRIEPALGQMTAETVFDAIDLQGGKARAITFTGARDVNAIQSEGGLTFIRLIPLIVTTVFPVQVGPSSFAAVQSRHTAILDHITAGQWHGTCQVIDEEYLRQLIK